MTKKHKILYVHHSGNLGGAPRSLSFLLDKLDHTLYETELLCISKGPGLKIFENRPFKVIVNERIFPFHGSTVSGMPVKLFLRNFLRAPQSFFAARQSIKKSNPDLIHLNSSSLFIVAIAARSLKRNIKIVCHIREPLLENSLSAWLIKTFCFFFVDQFIAIDKYSADSMKTRNNIQVIYNAVNFEDYNPSLKSDTIREQLKLPPRSILFLYLARFSPSNGTTSLLKVAQKLQAQHPDFVFVLAGYKPDSNDNYTKSIAKEANDCPNVHLMAFTNDVPNLLASCDILVVPFSEPHFARSVVEASAIAKPCIGTNIGGVNEIIVHEKTGFLYDNIEELSNYCILLGGDKDLRERMGDNAVAFAREHFDNKVNSAKIFLIYDELLRTSSRDKICIIDAT